MAVVEGAVTGMLDRLRPVLRQALPARADLHAEQLQAPQQGRAVEPLQVHHRGRAGHLRVVELQGAGGVERLEVKQRQVPPQMNRQAVLVGPVGLARAQELHAFDMPALHLHHMRDGVDRPRHPGTGFERAAAGRFGLRMQIAFFEAKGMHAEHEGPQRVVGGPLGQHARNAGAQAERVAAIEIEQVGRVQRQQVAGMLPQQLVPAVPGVSPASAQTQPGGAEVLTLARVCVRHQRLGGVEQAARLGQHRGLGQGQQEDGLGDARQAPAGIGGNRRVEVGERVAIKRDRAPQCLLGMRQRGRFRRADGAVARVVHAALVSPSAAGARAVARAASLPRRGPSGARRDRRNGGR